MDDETERRGKLPLHKAFNEAIAILTGDFLLTYSFEILATTSSLNQIERLALIETFSKKMGSEGILKGQVIDISKRDIETKTELFELYSRKTGELFALSFEFGAIIGGASHREMELLTEFGRLYGIAFQLIDDQHDSELPGFIDIEAELSQIGQQLIQIYEKLSIKSTLTESLIDQVTCFVNCSI